MPGIFGIIDPSLAGPAMSDELLETARLMLRSMRTEAWQCARLLQVPAAGACLGQVEIGSLESCLGPLIALTTGERAARPPRGVDAEEILRWNDGASAGVVADPRDGRVLVFNDRYGRERLFVHQRERCTYFASEAKAILAVCPEVRYFDGRGLSEYLACGCTLSTRSLFKQLDILESGTVLTCDQSGVHRRRYFAPQQLENRERVGPPAFREAFTDALATEVRAAAMSEPAAALSLTGGLDSRMVAACLPDGSLVPSFTFGSMYRTTADVSVARVVARACGLSHEVIELGRDFLSSFGQDLEQSVYLSDGYLGLSGAAELHVNRLARSLAPARMTGNWGGEMMRGVRAFKFRVPKGGFLRPAVVDGIAESEAAFSPAIADPLTGTLFHQMPLQGYGRYAIERSQVVTRTPFLAPGVVEALYSASPDVRRVNASAAAVIGQRPELLPLPTDAGVNVTRPARAGQQWRRLAIKAEYMTSHGAPDWLARVASVLPASALETRFLGVDKFYHFRHWMRHQLASTVNDNLSAPSPRLEEWLDLDRVRAMAVEHRRGVANHTDALDKVMTLVVAERNLLDDRNWKTRQSAMSASRDWQEPPPWG